MAEDDDLNSEQQRIRNSDSNFSLVVIRDSPGCAKDDLVVFPPINHENLQVNSSFYGFDGDREFPSESSSPSSSSRHSGSSSSSFSLFPSDSDAQPPLIANQFGRKSPSHPPEIDGKSLWLPSELGGESPPSDLNGQPTLPTCEIHQKSQSQPSEFDGKSPRSPSEINGESPLFDSDGKSLWKPLYRDSVDIVQNWWKLLVVSVYSKLKNLLTWFSTTVRSFYPVLTIAIWWWMRVRARRRRFKEDTMDHLRDAVKDRDERIIQLLHQIAQMNELLVKHHKDIIKSRLSD